MSATEIKLFGKIISFQCPILGFSISEDYEEEKMQFSSIEDALSSSSVSNEVTKKPEERQFTNSLKDSIPQRENPKMPSIITELDLQNKQSENNSESTTKKPENVLPCPRCDSANTKFCYFNNNNSAQPRYFCKNCQRYWTSGGTMRNVPVGSGRRKNKNAIALNYGQTMVSKSIQASQPYGEIFDFGSNAHAKPCESFTLKPKFGEKSHNCFRNGFHEPERKELSSDGSSIASSDSVENGGKVNSVIQESVMNNPGIWIFPCIYPPNCDSQILGKHPRETEMPPNPGENNLFFPKALRIGDPNESSKSSIWSALGIKNEKNNFVKGKVVFKALKSNENDVNYLRDNSLVLQANPAALARSLNFLENA